MRHKTSLLDKYISAQDSFREKALLQQKHFKIQFTPYFYLSWGPVSWAAVVLTNQPKFEFMHSTITVFMCLRCYQERPLPTAHFFPTAHSMNPSRRPAVTPLWEADTHTSLWDVITAAGSHLKPCLHRSLCCGRWEMLPGCFPKPGIGRGGEGVLSFSWPLQVQRIQ